MPHAHKACQKEKKGNIVHILDGHFREKESWYVMEFYFMGR